jgi:O-antigen/teichoic acid export membrane protein
VGSTGRGDQPPGGSARTTLAGRTIRSILWVSTSSAIVLALVAVRTIILARLLPIETFGVYALAAVIVQLSGAAWAFGLDGALVHRSPETADEDGAAAAHFSLTVLGVLAWGTLLGAVGCLWAEGPLRTALLALTTTSGALKLCQTPQALLVRRVTHRRLAVLHSSAVGLGSAVACWLAWRDPGIWALLSVDIVAAAVSGAALYLWRPVWRPRLAWHPPTIRYFLRFGARNAAGQLLLEALQRVDKLWVGVSMDRALLGLYSRASAHSSAGVAWVTSPLTAVARGTYAELKARPRRLAEAVSHMTGLLPRGSFPIAGALGLVAPELIPLLLGAKWLPMLEAFRILLGAALAQTLALNLGQLAIALGLPGHLAMIRAVQLALLVGTLAALGPRAGILGVALGVLASSLLGAGLLLALTRARVAISLSRLLLAPATALGAGLAAGASVGALLSGPLPLWGMGAVKGLAFTGGYVVVWILLERPRLAEMAATLRADLAGLPRSLGSGRGVSP